MKTKAKKGKRGPKHKDKLDDIEIVIDTADIEEPADPVAEMPPS